MATTRLFRIFGFLGATIFLFILFPQSSREAVLRKLAGVSKTEHEIKLAPKPRYVFVDLGANSADSLAVFLQKNNTKFTYDYPCPSWANHSDADIYLFEANPFFNSALIQAKEENNALGINVNIFPSTVVDIRDGTRTFFLDTVNEDNEFWGSSIYATHPDAIKSGVNGTELSAINISRWLLMNTLPRDFVVVKMDIEGAEYQVLPHMAEMSAWLVIDYLLIEWHDVQQFDTPEEPATFLDARAKAAIAKLEAGGVQIPRYDSPA